MGKDLCHLISGTCKRYNREFGECRCWSVSAPSGRVKVCFYLDVVEVCEFLADELRRGKACAPLESFERFR